MDTRLQSELARACGPGVLEAHFQPILDIATRLPAGAEALARWRRPDGSVAPPMDFIPALEASGAVRQLTSVMLGLALDAASDWQSAGHPCYVTVNLTARALLDPGFTAEVARELIARDVPPGVLVLELTERSIVSESEQAVKTIVGLREEGVRVALDDFGTGFSSLAHLIDLPVDAVKIDRRFVAAMTTSPPSRSIVEAVTGLAKKLGLAVIAEGVEDVATWDALRFVGADRAQGFLCARPTAADKMIGLLAELARAAADPSPPRPKRSRKLQSVR